MVSLHSNRVDEFILHRKRNYGLISDKRYPEYEKPSGFKKIAMELTKTPDFSGTHIILKFLDNPKLYPNFLELFS